jgi:phosphoribosylglycinamide formyltransferase 1
VSAARKRRKQVDVLVSGRGTNMGALIRAALDPEYPAAVKRVISNNPKAAALEIAAKYDIPAIVADHRDYDRREDHEAALTKIIDADMPDFICLAGYMRILTASFVGRYRGRIINIHPSIMPAFRGIDTHERVLAAGIRIHGASVHFVTEGVDEGPVIAQVAVAVETGDTVESLAARVLDQENLLYPHALRLAASGAARFSGGRVVVPKPPKGSKPGAALFSPPLPASGSD